VLDRITTKHVRRGGFCLLCILSLALAAPVHAAQDSADAHYPATTEELVATVKTAIETKSFETIDHLVNWLGISDYKRREFSTVIRHGLGRPIAKIELEQIDDETQRNLRNIKLHKLNMQVSHILRVTFADGEEGGVTPAAVYMIGRMADAYRIAMLVKEKNTTEND
jgi:NAD(P)-dependent dehydrogenase (short-subunit alcohol dehydrogenase family)